MALVRSGLEPITPATGKSGGCLVTRHGTLDFRRRTLIMAILNVTPDSFYDGGCHLTSDKAVTDGLALAAAGADIIDIGGESTRPGARPISEEEEIERVMPVIRGLRAELELPLSVDTYKAAVARAALDQGADIINDISALRFDPQMLPLVSTERVPVVLMHMQGTPRTMQLEPHYADVVADIRNFLADRLRAAASGGIESENIIIDPGIGFGKNLEHNVTLLRDLQEFTTLGQPLLVGASRKTFIGKLLDLAPEDRLEGSLAASVAAVLKGANIVRVHDVAETRRALSVADALRFG